MEIRCERRLWRDAIDFALFEKRGDKFFALQMPNLKETEEGEIIEPTFSLRSADAQVLIDELWRCGLRPTEGTGSAGSLAATERHLKDMQKIAFGLMKIDVQK